MWYEVRAADGATVLAYVSGSTFFVNNINLVDAGGTNVVANLYRNKLSLSAWEWRIRVFDTTHPAAHPTLLSLMAAQLSFMKTPGTRKDTTDICNSYFMVLGWVIVAVLCLAFVVACVLLWKWCKKRAHGASGTNMTPLVVT